MDCACHGIPALWQKDRRCRAGGRWECRVKRVAYNKTRSTNPARRATIRAHWHAPEGGYVQRRRRQLAAQRQEILNQLAQLDKEASEC